MEGQKVWFVLSWVTGDCKLIGPFGDDHTKAVLTAREILEENEGSEGTVAVTQLKIQPISLDDPAPQD